MPTISLEDVIASNPRFKGLDANKVREYYEDVLRARNPTVLPEVVVKTKSVKAVAKEARAALKAKMQEEALADMQNRLSLEDAFKFDSDKFNRDLQNKIAAANIDRYESMPARNAARDAYLSDPQFIYHRNLEAADNQVRRTAFSDDKTLNLIMNAMTPSQQVGAIRDGNGFSSYWESLRNGNSGFVTEEYAKRHPYLTRLLNTGGDLVIGGGINKLSNIKNIRKTLKIEKHSNPYKSTIDKRFIETFLRTTDDPVPIDEILSNIKEIAKTDKRRFTNIANYILFNKDKGWQSKSFAIFPEKYNGGLTLGTNGVKGDIIDAGLYGKQLDPRFAKLKSIGKDFGVHEDYINDNYSNIKNRIPVYEVIDNDIIEDYGIENIANVNHKSIKNLTYRGVDNKKYSRVARNDNKQFAIWNHGGFRQAIGDAKDTKILLEGDYSMPVTFKQDIYKFFPEDYKNSWRLSIDDFIKNGNPSKIKQYYRKMLVNQGLKFVNKRFTPIVVRGTKVYTYPY